MTDTLNKKLKARIFELYGTQTIFARVVGVRDCVVSRVVNGWDPLPHSEQKRWANALKCDPSIFRGGPVAVNNEW